MKIVNYVTLGLALLQLPGMFAQNKAQEGEPIAWGAL